MSAAIDFAYFPALQENARMGHFRALAAAPAAGAGLIRPLPRPSVLRAWNPPAAAAAAADVSFPRLGRWSYSCRSPKVALFAVRRVPFWYTMKGSDSDLAKVDRKRDPNQRKNGVFWIILLNLGIYVADHILQVREIRCLYLYHIWPEWYQFVTATFCHANWNHLSSNLFFLYIFGKLVEEEKGSFALWSSYILTGAGANFISWLLLPRSAISIGASGAIFGLFAISILVKISWDWRKVIEVLILGPFVISKVLEAAQASITLTDTFRSGSPMTVNHIAHLSGALLGAALVLLNPIPSQCSGTDV